MGTVESSLYGEEESSQQQAPPPTNTNRNIDSRVPGPHHGQPRRLRRTSQASTATATSTAAPLPLVTLKGIIVGLPSSGKQTLLERLKGKDPFLDKKKDQDKSTSTKPPLTSSAVLPYKVPQHEETWNRIRLHVEQSHILPPLLNKNQPPNRDKKDKDRDDRDNDIPSSSQPSDFVVLLINPRHDLKIIQQYLHNIVITLLSNAGYAKEESETISNDNDEKGDQQPSKPPTTRPINLCILLNFCDLHETSATREWVHQEDLTKMVRTALQSYNSLLSTEKTILIQYHTMSLLNCYGLEHLHYFIYLSYLQRIQFELLCQLQQVQQCWTRNSTKKKKIVSYDEFQKTIAGNDNSTNSEKRIQEKRNSKSKNKQQQQQQRPTEDTNTNNDKPKRTKDGGTGRRKDKAVKKRKQSKNKSISLEKEDATTRRLDEDSRQQDRHGRRGIMTSQEKQKQSSSSRLDIQNIQKAYQDPKSALDAFFADDDDDYDESDEEEQNVHVPSQIPSKASEKKLYSSVGSDSDDNGEDDDGNDDNNDEFFVDLGGHRHTHYGHHTMTNSSSASSDHSSVDKEEEEQEERNRKRAFVAEKQQQKKHQQKEKEKEQHHRKKTTNKKNGRNGVSTNDNSTMPSISEASSTSSSPKSNSKQNQSKEKQESSSLQQQNIRHNNKHHHNEKEKQKINRQEHKISNDKKGERLSGFKEKAKPTTPESSVLSDSFKTNNKMKSEEPKMVEESSKSDPPESHPADLESKIPNPEAKSQYELKTNESELKTEPESRPDEEEKETESKPELEQDTVEPEPEPESEPTLGETENKSIEPESEPEEPKPELGPESTPAPQSDPKSEPDQEPKPAPKSDAESERHSEVGASQSNQELTEVSCSADLKVALQISEQKLTPNIFTEENEETVHSKIEEPAGSVQHSIKKDEESRESNIDIGEVCKHSENETEPPEKMAATKVTSEKQGNVSDASITEKASAGSALEVERQTIKESKGGEEDPKALPRKADSGDTSADSEGDTASHITQSGEVTVQSSLSNKKTEDVTDDAANDSLSMGDANKALVQENKVSTQPSADEHKSPSNSSPIRRPHTMSESSDDAYMVDSAATKPGQSLQSSHQNNVPTKLADNPKKSSPSKPKGSTLSAAALAAIAAAQQEAEIMLQQESTPTEPVGSDDGKKKKSKKKKKEHDQEKAEKREKKKQKKREKEKRKKGSME